MASTTISKFAHLQIPLEKVAKATNDFHADNIIGHGGLGTAYKGQLLQSEKLINITAVRLDHKQGKEDVEFWMEISMLSDLKHKNIVSIIGFCDEKDEKIIIITYAANESLKKHLHNPNLTWTQRLKICIGVARALSYLHHDEGRDYGVIHLNINSSSILLDENWEPKLSGFKVSTKQAVNRMDQVILSETIGTRGYADPEIKNSKGVTHKSDIYSFGVVLFELLCGRKAYIKNEENRYLAKLAKHHYKNETLHDIIHPDLRNQMSPYSLKIYSTIAYSCLEKERADRPDILIIVDKLEKALKQALNFKPDFGNNLEHLKIQLHDIKLATHNFSDTYKTGNNDCYTFYKVKLEHLDREKPSGIEEKSKSDLPKRHNIVVIKRFLPIDDEQEEEWFFTELEMLSSVKHHNIVTLIGFCVEGSETMIVTENFSNGNLMNYLNTENDMSTFTWERRLKICIDVAKALDHLHSEMEDKKIIIHSTIDPEKIGLKDNWEAKIEDFEWAVILPPKRKDEGVHRKRYIHSQYHIDPEYKRTRRQNRKTDVYSFGVVLFEILCGRTAFDPIYLKESEEGLVHVARQNFYKVTLEDMIDPTLKEEAGKKSYIQNTGANKDSLQLFFKVANQCVAQMQYRPTMNVVLAVLEKALFLQLSQQQENDQVMDEPEIPSNEVPVNNWEHLKIRLADVKLATGDFSDAYKIPYAGGGYTLYRAELNHFGKENRSSVKKPVLIKQYPPKNRLIGEKEFFTEIEMLSRIKHPNIITLLGFCDEDSEMILVMENVSNKNLHYYLQKVNMHIFNWEKRLKLCIDVAHALKYIHYEMESGKTIINRDICSDNIWLDENLGPKIVNFWWSVFLPPNQEDEALYVKWIGRKSNIDPEHMETSKLKRESDVYSFGVVLFEVLCGRLADDPIYFEGSDKGLAHVARRRFHSRTLEEIIDPIIKDETGENNFVLIRGPNKDSLRIFTEIAHQCVTKTQGPRPTMKVVITDLEKALFFQKNNNDNPKISLEDIKVATQNFHKDNCIGGGGYGGVFKGKLKVGDRCKTIVAKRLDTKLGQGEQQFLTELQILLEYKHENVIDLIGYCDEQDEKIIVYEYASGGSLDRYLNNVSLTWVKRLNICIDVASALDYLHNGVGKQARVIHRDIKTANILLNNEWKAKLGDFGLSLISPVTQKSDYVIDKWCGTRGYGDPVYEKSRLLTIESDIYSFGVVLFEILCGRLVVQKHEGHDLLEFVRNRFAEEKRDEVVFKQLREKIVPESLAAFQEIAYQCLELDRQKRPTTKEVLMQLKKALEFQLNSEVKSDSEIHNKEKKSPDQTNDSTEYSGCCWPCGFRKVKNHRKADTPILGQISQKQMHNYEKDAKLQISKGE